MRRNFFKHAAILLAGILGTGTMAAPKAQASPVSQVANPFKSKDVKINTKHKVVREVGGLDLARMGDPGMTPKAYGQFIGSYGSKSGRSNKLRYSHNAKLKRRMA